MTVLINVEFWLKYLLTHFCVSFFWPVKCKCAYNVMLLNVYTKSTNKTCTVTVTTVY